MRIRNQTTRLMRHGKALTSNSATNRRNPASQPETQEIISSIAVQSDRRVRGRSSAMMNSATWHPPMSHLRHTQKIYVVLLCIFPPRRQLRTETDASNFSCPTESGGCDRSRLLWGAGAPQEKNIPCHRPTTCYLEPIGIISHRPLGSPSVGDVVASLVGHRSGKSQNKSALRILAGR